MRDEAKDQEEMKVEALVIRALERRPEVAVPEDFAARLAQSVPAKLPRRPELQPVFGRTAGYLAAALSMVLLMVLTRMHPQALEAGRGFVFAVELVVVAQLLAVGLWLGMRSDGA